MEMFLAILIVIAGLAAILYLPLWVMFIGGIMAIAHAVDTNSVTATLIALNVIKIILAPYVFALLFAIISFLFAFIAD